MTTIITNPPAQNDNGGGGFLVAIVVLIIAVALFFIYGLPAVRQQTQQQSAPQIKIPEKVDVNINQK